MRGRLVSIAFVLLLVPFGACAPQPGSTGETRPDSAVAAQPRASKTLTVAVQRELPGWGQFSRTGSGSSTSGGARSVEKIAQDVLATEKDLDTYVPQLATALPSVERGTWRVNPDGTMDVTWVIHPNIKWHDGTVFTSDDLLFSFEVFKDPELPTTASQRALIETASAPDSRTSVVRWKQPYVSANRTQHGDILARHLFEELYRTDKASLPNTPLLTTEFVGLGPYRLSRWEQGSHLEFVRFEDYYQGRPPLDRIVVRFISDANAMVAAILAGEVDVVLPVAVDLEAALEVKQRWEGTGHQVRTDITGRVPHLEMQHRPDVSRPRNGLTNRTVRQALYQAIDRTTLADVMSQGPCCLKTLPYRKGNVGSYLQITQRAGANRVRSVSFSSLSPSRLLTPPPTRLRVGKACPQPVVVAV